MSSCVVLPDHRIGATNKRLAFQRLWPKRRDGPPCSKNPNDYDSTSVWPSTFRCLLRPEFEFCVKSNPWGLLYSVEVGLLMMRVAITLLFASSIMFGGPVTWDLSHVTFNDGGSASGFFVFNADTHALTAWDISTTAGTALGSFEYTTADSTGSSSNSLLTLRSNQTFPTGSGPSEARFLDLGFATPLSDAGRSVDLIANQPFGGTLGGSGECLNCDPFRTVTGGAVVSTSTPEPGPLGVLLAGATALAFVLRRKTLPSMRR